MEKVKWCKDAYEYYKCASSYITNCTVAPVADDVGQLTVFLDYIEKSANRECPGGLAGCTDKPDEDANCHDKISFFLEKNALVNQISVTRISPFMLFFIFFYFII